MKADVAGIERQLEEGLEQLDLALSGAARTQLLRYLGLLQKWNRVYNLTAIRQPGRLVSHHLLDSLAILPHLSGPTLVDVGTGAGLPGIPIAIARRDWQVVLLDSNHKKGAFLKQVVVELELANAHVQVARAEQWRPTPLAATAVSRAFSDLAGFAEAARHMVVPNGMLAAMKGLYPNEELEQLPEGIVLEKVVPLEVRGLRAARHLVLMRVADQQP